jgi:hypothetical protein
MPSNDVTRHAAIRMAQRGIHPDELELIAIIGTEVQDGYLVRDKDYQRIERMLKQLLQRIRRLKGKRIVIEQGKIITAYHASRRTKRHLMRSLP